MKEWPKIKLRPHQINVVEHVRRNYKGMRGILLYHGLGSGKTLSSLALLALFLGKHPEQSAIISTPASLVARFNDEMEKFHFPFRDRVEVMTHTRLAMSLDEDPDFCKSSVVVVDEFHNFRNAEGQEASAVVDGLKKAAFAVLLSATPVYNGITDLAPVMAILRHVPVNRATSALNAAEEEEASEVVPVSTWMRVLRPFVCHNMQKGTDNNLSCVSAYADETREGFPDTREEMVNIPMSRDFLVQYLDMERQKHDSVPERFKDKNVYRFLNGLRQGANKLFTPSEKLAWTLDKIREVVLQKGRKMVIFSTWKDSGLDMIADAATHEMGKAARLARVDGSMSLRNRKDAVDAYNRGDVSVLFISSAGAEGLDLKRTYALVVYEPHWNIEKINQVIGRAVRYQSHAGGGKDPEDHMVYIYKLNLVKPPMSTFDKVRLGCVFSQCDRPSVDQILWTLSESKQRRLATLSEALKQLSIEKSGRV